MRIVRWLIITGLLAAALVNGVAAAQTTAEPVVVIEVADPLDQRSLDFVVGAIADAPDAHAYILKIDSPGVSSGDLTEAFAAVTQAPAPVVAWIGPNPSVAYGGSAYLANHADIRSAAPGAVVGYLEPAVLRGEEEPPSVRPGDDVERFAETVDALATETVTVGGDVEQVYGFVERLDPALGPLIISLDGEVVERGDTTFTLDTAKVEVIEGQEVLVQARPVTFVKPGLLDRFLRLGARPETAFLFLVFGLAFAAFEFYAAGTGLMAFVASMSLILSGYGLATLPMWWPAVLILLAGMALLVWGFVQNRVDWRAVLGTAALLVAGLTFTTTRPQYPPAWWMVLLATAGTVLFVWYSLTTVVRGRFATPTVGRDELLGQRCLVVETLDPLGVVTIDGARWQATADRGVEIRAGAPAEIVGITGLLLEVDPVAPPPPRSREESS